MPPSSRPYSRGTFLSILGLGGLGTTLGASSRVRPFAPDGRPGFRQALEPVQAMVGAAHRNLAAVEELLRQQPGLAKASWDWGFGDWESALGAASHTGAKEIAELLIGHGARPTIFSSAMLGEIDVVRAALRARPELAQLHGPHGIPLLNHARAGGADAAEVVGYLTDEIGVGEAPFGVPAAPELEARYGGRYTDRDDPEVSLTVAATARWLMIGAGEAANSRVLEAAPDVFFPTGAPEVRIRFHVEDGWNHAAA